MTSAGNLVTLGHADGTVVNVSTGRTIKLERRGGVYIMKMFIADAVAPLPGPNAPLYPFVADPREGGKWIAAGATPFHRQGA